MASLDLVPRFQFKRLLKQDSAGRQICLLGTIDDKPSILIAERAAFSTDSTLLRSFTSSLSTTASLGQNDIYNWYLANTIHAPDAITTRTSSPKVTEATSPSSGSPPDLKLTLIHPSDAKHIQKYSIQRWRMVTETKQIYADYIRPYIANQVRSGRTDWVINILEGRKEQDSILHRGLDGLDGADSADCKEEQGYILLPDLKWDKKTLSALDLLVIVRRRDIFSLRDLTRAHVPWLKALVQDVRCAVERLYADSSKVADSKNAERDGLSDSVDGVEGDMLKFYVHYHPTYYHFHIHVTHTQLEPNASQATGKAVSVQSIISQLESMDSDKGTGMADVDIEYAVGEESELWKKVFGPLKRGETPVL